MSGRSSILLINGEAFPPVEADFSLESASLKSSGKDIPKVAVWNLELRNTPEVHARELTSFVASEIGKPKEFEVYSQEIVRTLAGGNPWTGQLVVFKLQPSRLHLNEFRPN